MVQGIVGIHLGSSFCSVSALKNEQPYCLVNEDGERFIPTCVAFLPEETLYGSQASSCKVKDPSCVIDNFLYFFAADGSNEAAEHYRSSHTQHCKWNLKEKEGKFFAAVTTNGEEVLYSLEQILKTFLEGLKGTIEANLGTSIIGAVISVPSIFKKQNMAIISEIVNEVGIPVLSIQNDFESVLNCLKLDNKADESMLMIQAGGNFSAFHLVYNREGLLVADGSLVIPKGGRVFDSLVLGIFREEFQKKFKTPLNTNSRSFLKLSAAAEKAKCSLSSSTNFHCLVESLYEGIDFSFNLTRTRYESLLVSFCNDFMVELEGFLSKLSLKPAEISQVILMGGSFRTPHLVKVLKTAFPQVHSPVDLDELACKGAAIQAQRLMEQVELSAGRVEGMGLLKDIVLSFQGKNHILAKYTPLPFKKTYDINASPEPFSIEISEETEICRLQLPASDLPGKLAVDADASQFSIGIEYANESHQVDLLKK